MWILLKQEKVSDSGISKAMLLCKFAPRSRQITMPALSFYRAMLCIRGTSHGPVSVRVCVCLSQVGVLLKRLNVGSRKQHHTIAQGL